MLAASSHSESPGDKARGTFDNGLPCPRSLLSVQDVVNESSPGDSSPVVLRVPLEALSSST